MRSHLDCRTPRRKPRRAALSAALFAPRLVSAALVALTLALAAPSRAQLGDVPKPAQLVKVSASALSVPAGGKAEAIVTLSVLHGWHINANPAANEDAIPTVASVKGDAALAFGPPSYPPAHVVKLPIDDQPLKVWDGETTIRLPVAAAKGAAAGMHAMKGEIRFQACNDQLCLPPATIAFDLAVSVSAGGTQASAGAGAAPTSNGAGSAAVGGTGAPSGASSPTGIATGALDTAPPPGARTVAARGPLADVLERGGWAAFLTLFLIGLALNLTPCVYPMLGVTVSIFGARRAAPPLQVIGSALLYVLGMATMYSALGLAAAFTGGLFGGWLANPLVSVGIGVLLIALSFSMFGLYELNLPPALLSRLGGTGTTSALGLFGSGLMVGVFAAPCIGAPIVALLAVVGQRGDPLFGFTSFFTLAMGLGAPYLVLGTFSNLIQRMPRSGEWMVWVKKVFGLILFSIGLNYALLALVPVLAAWVLPAALLLGGVWLGLFDRTGSARAGFRAFKRIAGVGAILAGTALVALAPRAGVVFQPFTTLGGPLESGGKPVLIEFSAAWCIPCHEMDRVTFPDGRVVMALRDFKLYKVDLTRFDSPQAGRWRHQFGISGVPTLVFVRPDGREITSARIVGFAPPEALLERIQMAQAAIAEK